MESVARLFLVGLSHRTAPLAIRERHAVDRSSVPLVLARIAALDVVEEVALVSTCNRTEIVLVARAGVDPVPAAIAIALPGLAGDHLYVHRGLFALIHLFRLASGLDSLVVGESEILAQTREAFDIARRAGTIGKLLQPLFEHALSAGKRVRSETELGLGTLSVARVAAGVARQALGDLADRRTLVIGAGETGLLVARHLASEGSRRIDFANRTLERARVAASEMHGEAFALEALPDALQGADLVVVCVDGGGALVRPEHFDRRALTKRDRPTVVIDLSVPRAVAREVRDLYGVLAFDIDDLEPVVRKNLAARTEAIERCDEILVGEVHKFLALRTYAAFSPAIAALHERFGELRDEVLDAVAGSRAEPREVQLAHELTRKLLDAALEKMKESARRARSEEYLDAEYQRFLESL
jgi:glutamyl-tRNA reductase